MMLAGGLFMQNLAGPYFIIVTIQTHIQFHFFKLAHAELFICRPNLKETTTGQLRAPVKRR